MNHRDEVLKILLTQVGSSEEVAEIRVAAEEVEKKWINPLSEKPGQTNGLIYGLVQSGKTGVLTVTGAIGADKGYKIILILTSDIDPLYEQTMDRVHLAFPGLEILGKNDINDADVFAKRIRETVCVVVMTKNALLLKKIIGNFVKGRLRNVPCLIIDDEADQASPNTKAKKNDGSTSNINGYISDIRDFFNKNTYLQVTATPQALFLQESDHAFRPKFTVLSHPGVDYVGGDDFFEDNSKLITEFALKDLTLLSPGAQPSPSTTIPVSLLRALDTFVVGATYKRGKEPDQNCAFLCHVSTKKEDHLHIVELLRKYKIDLTSDLKKNDLKVVQRLRQAYEDLSQTHDGLRKTDFNKLLTAMQFYSAGMAVKLVNGDTDDDVALKGVYNLFVGGNKLGRGVTIKNLLVSYYGRNPKAPQADTVLQHARMYGYRRKDIGLLRLFLPNELHTVFRSINKMEQSLRELIANNPEEGFRGIYLEKGLSATRKNILVPGAVGVYTAGRSYNPSQILRDVSVNEKTKKIDKEIEYIDDKHYAEMTIEEAKSLLSNIMPDESDREFIWDRLAIAGSIEQYSKLKETDIVYVYVDRDRDLNESRRETQGILSGGEDATVPSDHVTIFMLRTLAKGKKQAAWWPQVRFPKGKYAFAFAV